MIDSRAAPIKIAALGEVQHEPEQNRIKAALGADLFRRLARGGFLCCWQTALRAVIAHYQSASSSPGVAPAVTT